MSRRRVSAVVAVSAAMMGLGVAAAVAASSGTVSFTEVSGASFSGQYRYGVAVSGHYPTTGIEYSGTLKNNGKDTNTAYFQARVKGYGWVDLGSAALHRSTPIDRVVYDPAALYVTTSQARTCRHRTLLAANCYTKTYNK